MKTGEIGVGGDSGQQIPCAKDPLHRIYFILAQQLHIGGFL